MPKNMLNVELISGNFGPTRIKVEFDYNVQPAGITERPIHARAGLAEYFILLRPIMRLTEAGYYILLFGLEDKARHFAERYGEG